MYKWILILFTIIILGNSCASTNNNIDEDAVPWKLLLDNKTYVTKQFLQYGRQPITFISTHQVVGHSADTSYFSGLQIDWKMFIQPFVDASLYDSTNDRKYRVTQIKDSSSGKVQLTYLPSFSNLPVSKMFLTIDELDSKITTIYIERKKVEGYKTTKYKILYNAGNLIQLQTETIPLIGKNTYTIDQLIFML